MTTHCKIKLFKVWEEMVVVVVKLFLFHDLENPNVAHWNRAKLFEVIKVSERCTGIGEVVSVQGVVLDKRVFIE